MTVAANLTCDAIKIAYRQSKDGFVVSFAIHPQDMPAALANADIGTQWQLRLVELDDDGNAPQPAKETPAKPQPKAQSTSPAGARQRGVCEAYGEPLCIGTCKEPKDCTATPAKPRTTVSPEKRLAQQAGILCSDPVFQQFLFEHDMIETKCEEQATIAVRWICGVVTRADIVPGLPAGQKWEELTGKFEGWKVQ